MTNNLIGVDTVASIDDDGGNLTGTGENRVDPRLGLLTDHGGPTYTRALLGGSPAT